MKNYIILFLLFFSVTACDSLQKKTQETINKGGEVVGKSATEFIEGVSDGVDKTLQCELSLSESLKDKGVKTGKFSIADTLGGKHNLLVLYLIFDKDFNGTISAKVFDQDNLEMGRKALSTMQKSGEAMYFDFVFDKRTYIESRSKIIVE
ncbi:MAG TPA: hypothetical protein VIM65_23305 [Cyclobacteriaceae bacterium]